MHMHVWVLVGMMLAAVYVVPIAVGLAPDRRHAGSCQLLRALCLRLVGIAAAVGASGERRASI
jgi:nitric oxide reductase large subunit